MAPFLGSEGPAVKDAKEYDPLSGEPDLRLPQRFSGGFQFEGGGATTGKPTYHGLEPQRPGRLE